jgi:exopolysaccharide biosynthesis polyprenyl glycosylphosphotransferase
MSSGGSEVADANIAASPGHVRDRQALATPPGSPPEAPNPSAPEAPHPSPPGPAWQRRYQLGLVGIDFCAVVVAIVAGYVLRFGLRTGTLNSPDDLAFSILLPVFWIAAVAVNRGYETRFVGAGTTEFERVFRSFLHVTVLTSFVAFATKSDLARGFVTAVLPLALLIDLTLRCARRRQLHQRRSHGSALTAVLAVGGPASLARFTRLLSRDRFAGLHVVGACVPAEIADDAGSAATEDLAALGVPVLGDADAVVSAAQRCGADTVAVLSGEVSPEKLRWISWQLEGTEIGLIVSPGLTEVAGRRLHIQPVDGLPLLYVDEPEFSGFRRVVKAVFDRSMAALALLLLAPLLIVLALLVRATSAGPALFRQRRVGLHGELFTLLKFRSMCADAEQRLSQLRELNDSDGVLFKVRRDPRVTRIGRVMRKYSLDELPQLINVLCGQMSLVGPRPPLPDEVDAYGADVRRRLLVKPGITGLWQVSGRSDLSWEESVRLDLRYVENWSLALDVIVLFKTAGAVFTASGAY